MRINAWMNGPQSFVGIRPRQSEADYLPFRCREVIDTHAVFVHVRGEDYRCARNWARSGIAC